MKKEEYSPLFGYLHMVASAADEPIVRRNSDSTETPRTDPIKHLLARKFGNRGLGLVREGESETPPELARKIAEYREYLEGLSNYHLLNLFREEEARALYDEQHFHKPSADADFEYWARMPHWTVDEAVALTLGKAPEQLRWHTVEKAADRSSVAAEYRRRRELALRSLAWKHLTDPVLPSVFITWADRIGMTVPDGLRTALDAQAVKEPDYRSLYESLLAACAETENLVADVYEELRKMKAHQDAAQAENRASKAIGTKERESMMAIIAGMAMEGYKYNPASAKNLATKDIASDIAQVGLSLDVDTVRKYVSAAVKFASDNGKRDF